jgi:methyl-accepting chemotaxis protein
MNELVLTKEEIERVSKIVANAIKENVKAQASIIASVVTENNKHIARIVAEVVTEKHAGFYFIEIIREEEARQRINLDLISSALHGITDPLGQLQSWLSTQFYNVINTVYTYITSWIQSSALWYWVSDIWDRMYSVYYTITSALPSVGVALASLPSYIYNNIMSFITVARDTLSSYISGVTNFFTNTLPSYFSVITNFFTYTVPNLFPIVTNFFTNVIPSYFSMVTNFFTNAIPQYFNIVTKFFTEAIPNYFSIVTNFFTNTFPQMVSTVARFFTETLPQYISYISNFFTTTLPKAIESVTTFFSKDLPTLIDRVRGFIATISQIPLQAPDIIKSVAFAIWNTISTMLYNELFVKYVFPTVQGVTQLSANVLQIGVSIQGFVNAVLELPRNIQTMVEKFAEVAWSKVQEFIARVRAGLELIVEVGTKVVKTIYERITSFANWLYESFSSSLSALASIVENAVLNAIAFIAEKTLDIVRPIVQRILDIAKRAGEGIGKLIVDISVFALTPIYDAFAKWSATQLDRLANKFLEIDTPAENVRYFAEALHMIVFDIVNVHYATWGVSFALHRFAGMCEDLQQNITLNIEGEGGCALEPGGLGVRLKQLLGMLMSLGWKIKPSWMFREIAKDVRELSDTFTRGLMYGLTIWMTNPIVKLLNAAYRDILVIDLPSIPTMQEIVRRHMPTDQFDYVLKRYVAFLKLYGYRTEIIKWITDTNIKIEVVDRFGTKRTIPLALIYEMPSASDVAKMAIRDIFGMGADAVSAFLKVYSARGMHQDIGVLYYLLHYKYPPPERLWTFTTRAISGLLWATITPDMKDKIKAEANSLGAVEPTDARYWNFKAKEVFSVLQTYMTWHDYARFSWIRKELLGLPANFTSDNQIIIDTLADIPTKIDQRWMIKWGLYEHLSAKGVTINSEVKEFATRVLESNPASGIRMDITNFSRTLQATGLHPDWIPVTAVAETMNMLTEERTLLRTGFMNLFKEGFYDWTALEKLLAGFIKASFQVAYFDSEKMTWTTGWINLPVMFLPPERRLLELRALMDRALDILREIQRDVTTAYQEFIIDDYDEYKQRLSSVIDSINEFYAKDYENITESTLPDELKLKFVEDYYKPYVRALDIWRDVYTIRRMRTWASRWLGWVIYRMAFGYVSKEDVNKVLDYVSKACKLAPKETDFIRDVMELLADIAKRETVSQYLPTPSTMATLSEYITLDAKIVEQVLTERGIPDYWKQVWLTYISVRPIKSDASALLSAYIRAFRYGVVSKAEVDAFISSLASYGFTKREIEIRQKIADLEEMILQARESMQQYIPTPMTLATICEYLPEAREFFDDVVKAKRIPQNWVELWATYIDIKPLIDDMKRYLARAEDLYVRFMIDKRKFDEVLNEVAGKLGYTPKEIEFLRKVTEFERYKNAWIELIGTVNRLVELSEYSPTASEWAIGKLNAMIDALPLSDDEKRKLKTMWEEYIRNRPVKSEAKMYLTQLINAYVDGIISDTDFDRELQNMKKWGFSDTELQFYKQIATVRKARKLRIPLVYGE